MANIPNFIPDVLLDNSGRPVADPPLVAADPLRNRPGDRWAHIDTPTGRHVWPEPPPAQVPPYGLGHAGL
jgi:hypothetical protein